MLEKHLFEYATLRVSPSVVREEFINVGVVLFCPSLKFLDTLFLVQPEKISALSKDIDLGCIQDYLESFQKICHGKTDSGPIGKLILSTRFRWLTAYRSTVLQTSRVHPGFCISPEETLHTLFNKMVL